MDFIKNFILTILSLLLIISLAIFALAISANTLLYPTTYEQAFEKNNLYSQFENNINNDSRFMFTNIKEQGIKETLNLFLENTLSYLRNDKQTLELKLKIDKTALNSFYESEAKKFPACSEGTQPFIDDEVICKPKNMNSSEFVKTALARKNITLAETDYINLAKEMDKQNNLEKLRKYINKYKLLMYGSIALALIIILVVFLIKKEIKSSARWLGTAFALAGLTIISASFLVKEGISQLIQQTAFRPLVFDILSPFFSRFTISGIIILAAGILILIISFLFKKPSKH